MALSTFGDDVLLGGGCLTSNIFVCSQLERDDIWWVKRDLVRMNGIASEAAAASANTAALCLHFATDSRLPAGQTEWEGGGGDRGWWPWLG